jgi:hypothetical protein
MRNVRDVTLENQGSSRPLAKERKIGQEIVRSTELTSRFFCGPRPTHHFPIGDENQLWGAARGAGDPMNWRHAGYSNEVPTSQVDSSDWYERATGRPRPRSDKGDFSSLPLFGAKR